MKKRFARFALGLMTFALFVMTAHVFTHAFSAAPESLIQCRVCQSLAGLSAPSSPAAAPAQTITPEEPRLVILSAPVLLPGTKSVRAPPIV